jgi:hypothetical protein
LENINFESLIKGKVLEISENIKNDQNKKEIEDQKLKNLS